MNSSWIEVTVRNLNKLLQCEYDNSQLEEVNTNIRFLYTQLEEHGGVGLSYLIEKAKQRVGD